MSKKLATAIKEARTAASLTQQELASKIDGLSASDISKIERNEKDPTTDQIKAIAKATGVTQKSLLELAGKSTTSSSSSSSSSQGTSMKVSSTEKKLVELYRKADSDTKKEVMKLLKGESTELDGSEILSSLIGTAMESLLKK